MKSEHRHELKTNELADWIAHFPQWARKNLYYIIAVAVFIVAVTGSALYFKQSKKDTYQEMIDFTNLLTQSSQLKIRIISQRFQAPDSQNFITSDEFTNVAKNLLTFAEKTKNDSLAALAYIKRAEALRSEIKFSIAGLAPSEIEIETQLKAAKQSYTNALQKAQGNPNLTGNAQLGIGICTEDLGDFNGAQQIYTKITEDEKLKATIAYAQAKQRLEVMDDYKIKIVFKPAPKPFIPPRARNPEVINFSDFNIPSAPPMKIPTTPYMPVPKLDIPDRSSQPIKMVPDTKPEYPDFNKPGL